MDKKRGRSRGKKPNFDIQKFDDDDLSDSGDDFSDGEKQMLEESRNKRMKEDFDSEDEVFKLGNGSEESDNAEEKDSMESDIEGLEGNDDDLPDDRAWGQKKKSYYSTDYVDQDYSTSNQKDMLDAELEEQEARNIQKRLAEQLDDADFGLDLVEVAERKEVFRDSEEIVKTDLSKLSKRQKEALLLKESPEFAALVSDFKDRLNELKTILEPFLKFTKAGKCPPCQALTFVKTKHELLLNYLTNISFYLILKAQKSSVTTHPVIKRLAQYRQLLGQMESSQGNLLEQIKLILEADKRGEKLYNLLEQVAIKPSKKSKKPKNKQAIEPSMEDWELSEGSDNEFEVEDSAIPAKEGISKEDEKRAITYQIAKNKGLTPRRKKEQRNPRVKHRNKFRKAKIRRKGAVREVRTETRRYDGEISGIKANVKKSIKLK